MPSVVTITSPRGKAMQRYLPQNVYGRSRLLQALHQAQGAEFDRVREALSFLLDQFFVRTASDPGLTRWELEEGLPVSPDKPAQERQEKIIAHMRGTPTSTIRMLKALAASFENGSVHVVEDYQQYALRVIFFDPGGLPANAGDLQAAIRAAAQAHLQTLFDFNFTTWNDLGAQNWTWNQLAGIDPGGPAGAPLTFNQLSVLL